MKTITFVEHSGDRHEVPLEAGQTLSQLAQNNQVPGIDGDCGGNCACATCHVFMPENLIATLGKGSEMEQQMLDIAPELRPTSRLSCQITVSDDMAGIEVHLPEFQI